MSPIFSTIDLYLIDLACVTFLLVMNMKYNGVSGPMEGLSSVCLNDLMNDWVVVDNWEG